MAAATKESGAPSMEGVLCGNRSFPLTPKELKALISARRAARIEAIRHLSKLNAGKTRDLSFLSDYSEYFSIDDDCLCRQIMNKSDDANIWKQKEYGRGAVGVASLLTTRKEPVSSYIMKSVEGANVPPYIGIWLMLDVEEAATLMNPSILKNLTKFRKRSGSRVVEKLGYIVAKGTDFSNQTCMHLIFNEILQDSEQYVYQYDAFYCGSTGYNIMDIASERDFSAFLDNNNFAGDRAKWPGLAGALDTMMTQLMFPLAVLKSDLFGFVHADLKCRNLFLHKGAGGELIFKLGDFDKSSIFWNGVRFYNSSNDYLGDHDNHTSDSTVPYNMLRLRYPSGEYSSCVFDAYQTRGMAMFNVKYQALVKLSPAQPFTMYNPLGFFLTFDIYTLVVSCLLEPQIYFLYRNQYDCKFFRFVHEIFTATALEALKERLVKLHTNYRMGQDIKPLRSIGTTTDIMIGIPFIHSMRDIINIYNRIYTEHTVADAAVEEYLRPHIARTQEALTNANLSKGDKICLTPCDKGRCTTPKYSSRKTIYAYDNCE
jgi:hypothetical protein